jgi:hypothetical protein
MYLFRSNHDGNVYLLYVAYSLTVFVCCFHNKNVEKQSNSHNMVTFFMSVSLDIQDPYSMFSLFRVPQFGVQSVQCSNHIFDIQSISFTVQCTPCSILCVQSIRRSVHLTYINSTFCPLMFNRSTLSHSTYLT